MAAALATPHHAPPPQVGINIAHGVIPPAIPWVVCPAVPLVGPIIAEVVPPPHPPLMNI